MYNGFGILFGSDIDHFNSAPPELTVLSMEAPHTQRMRPIRSSHLAAIIQDGVVGNNHQTTLR
ncbi:hypothetical protein INR49_027613 [Caranx melampygus]|nr:hypothetical protein INR49_027613 [Caranx melampygus]